MEDHPQIAKLLAKSILLGLDRAETTRLEEWLGERNNRLLHAHILEKDRLCDDLDLIEKIESRKAAVFSELFGESKEPISRGFVFRIPVIGLIHIGNIRKFAVAVSTLIVIVVAVCWYFLPFTGSEGRQAAIPTVKLQDDDIPPGIDTATLIASNGETITLDSATRIVSKKVDGVYINSEGALLTYSSGAADENGPVTYHVLRTPKAGQYKLVLPDKSVVFLNAASSLRYPVAFTGGKRTVELLEGEAFFEVRKNVQRPFVVKVTRPAGDPYEVRVTGTHFRVSAYPNEDVSTLLVEGTVNVHASKQNKRLEAGQEAVLTRENQLIVGHGDTASAQWRYGKFVFKDEDMRSVMRQIERWYDVKIEYHGEPTSRCDGTISRSNTLQFVLRSLEYTSNYQAYFTVEGRTVHVYTGARK